MNIFCTIVISKVTLLFKYTQLGETIETNVTFLFNANINNRYIVSDLLFITLQYLPIVVLCIINFRIQTLIYTNLLMTDG